MTNLISASANTVLLRHRLPLSTQGRWPHPDVAQSSMREPWTAAASELPAVGRFATRRACSLLSALEGPQASGGTGVFGSRGRKAAVARQGRHNLVAGMMAGPAAG
ncbi:MAG TPA: hypothetical protein VHU91_07155 [Mycobacteriales bacterium]|nr:hypothetical protein [Mycobacteriales bacterium]